MADYDNTNTGALFKSEEKLTEKYPDYKGSINVNGEEFWLSAWLKTSKAGKKFMSLSVSPKNEQAQKKSAPADDSEDVPF